MKKATGRLLLPPCEAQKPHLDLCIICLCKTSVSSSRMMFFLASGSRMQMHADFSPPPEQLSQRWPASDTACSKHKISGRTRVCFDPSQIYAPSCGGDQEGGGCSALVSTKLCLCSEALLERHATAPFPPRFWLLLPISAAPRCDPGPSASRLLLFSPSAQRVGVRGV